MLKRKDGSVSQRGLWDNIRANKGSGKKPTAQMLKQEKKIKSVSKMQAGGTNDTIKPKVKSKPVEMVMGLPKSMEKPKSKPMQWMQGSKKTSDLKNEKLKIDTVWGGTLYKKGGLIKKK